MRLQAGARCFGRYRHELGLDQSPTWQTHPAMAVHG